MSANLVFNAQGQAMMCYRGEVPWHKEGTKVEDLSIDKVHEILETDKQVTCENLYAQGPDGEFIRIPDRMAIMWNGNCLGVVTENYATFQDHTMFEQCRVFEEKGFQVETAGRLAGGAKTWIQFRTPGLDPVTIRPGDEVQAFTFMTNGHDGKTAGSGGYTGTRIVCQNTLSIALSNNLSLLKFRHQGNVAAKHEDVVAKLAAIKTAFDKECEAYKFLAETPVTNQAELVKFVQGIKGEPQTGTYPDRAGKRGRDPMSLVNDIELMFLDGIGNRGESYWDLFNAWTERSTHEEGNTMQSDGPGDARARRLESLYFGSVGASNVKALSVALKLAQAAR